MHVDYFLRCKLQVALTFLVHLFCYASTRGPIQIEKFYMNSEFYKGPSFKSKYLQFHQNLTKNYLN
jgi:hypothetical protein